MTAASPKPLVQIACVCEKALIEPDNVVSLIRVVDTYTVDAPPELPAGVGVALNLTVFVSLKSGDVAGQYEVGLRLNSPDGEASPMRRWPVVLNGGEHGANIKIDFALATPKYGLYWFDVLWGEEALTRIPFRLKAKTESTASEAVSSEMARN